MLQAFSQAEILIGSRFQQGLPAVQHTVKAQLAHELFMDRWIHRFYLFEVEGLLEILFATDVRMLWQTHWLTGGGFPGLSHPGLNQPIDKAVSAAIPLQSQPCRFYEL